MADHADPERAQGSAANRDAAVVPEAEIPSDQEIAGPMLDVHAPHPPVSPHLERLLHNRATKRILSSILDNTFQGMLRPPQMPKSVTHVLGRSVTYVPGRTIGIPSFQ